MRDRRRKVSGDPRLERALRETKHAIDAGDQEDPPREPIAGSRGWLDVLDGLVGRLFSKCSKAFHTCERRCIATEALKGLALVLPNEMTDQNFIDLREGPAFDPSVMEQTVRSPLSATLASSACTASTSFSRIVSGTVPADSTTSWKSLMVKREPMPLCLVPKPEDLELSDLARCSPGQDDDVALHFAGPMP